jgi:hypothetical protein
MTDLTTLVEIINLFNSTIIYLTSQLIQQKFHNSLKARFLLFRKFPFNRPFCLFVEFHNNIEFKKTWFNRTAFLLNHLWMAIERWWSTSCRLWSRWYQVRYIFLNLESISPYGWMSTYLVCTSIFCKKKSTRNI